MYIPKHFEVTDSGAIYALIKDYPLATLITFSKGRINANHIPLNLSISTEPCMKLQGHVSRSNPLLNDIDAEVETLAIFLGPNAYISPSWYATKKESGKVVPTWNYVAVHAYGNLKIVDDTDWLRTQLETLTKQHEANLLEPWSIHDAPTEFTNKLMESIIGIEMRVARLLGKWKVSQNQPVPNKEGVVKGLQASNQLGSLEMAKLIKEAY
jgi:transcriptional regulator